MLSVSVVVPVRNASRTLPACLTALEQLRPPPAEIILVDNGSTDGSLTLLHDFARRAVLQNVRVCTAAKRGASSARNAGVRGAHGDIIAFTDADGAPDPAWLRHLLEPFVDATVGAVAGRVVAARALSTLELFSALYTLQAPDRPARHTHWTPWEGGYPTANLAVRRRLLAALDGFDENVGIYGEDYDLCARLYARGAALVYVPQARVAHYHRTTLAGMLRQAFGFGRSHPYLLCRHAASGLWLDLPWVPLRWQRCPARAWVDLASADKKALALVALGVLYRPMLWLLLIYGLWLVLLAGRRVRQLTCTGSLGMAVELAGLLLLKSIAMTAGRWWGSLKYGTVCF